ncbi:hypothetical protein RclHR1_07930015 [Rhizophagus clarus]|uniref:Uncharacterized protein n=1 Tax=Rhizophagus clarus TaxID=94130 RepID=A0A2Z6RYL1_9GLOM|nr:hypothetical protein RclHR1_07930015 [Rhizophagus clarus]GES97068.1 hypothetical protein GLOIN_2v1646215 [Rhizophagus clarus]
MQSPNLKEQNSNNRHDDKSWECFRNFACVHMWDGFVYLFIVVCDSENNLDHLMDNFSELRNRILYLHRHGGASDDKYDKTNDIIDRYIRSRFKKDEDMRNKVMLSVYKQLESHNIYDPYLRNMIQSFDKMSRFQRKTLREMFLSRIYGYSKFSEYLFNKWNNTKNNKDEVLRSEDKKVKQNVDQNINKHNTKNKKEDSHQEDKGFNSEEQKVDQRNDQNKNEHHTKNMNDEDPHQEDIKGDVEEQNVADESKSEHEENNTQNQSMEEKKHDYKETTSRSSTNKKGSKSKDKTSMKSTKADNTIEKKPKENQKKALKVGKLQQEIVTLQQEIITLRQEAANHQAALGGIMNVGWRDDDSNNSMQLTKDIEKLQKDLADFTRVKRGGINIKFNAASRLFESYGCKIYPEKTMKLVLSAVLQQHLIKIILKVADSYFTEAFNDNVEKDQENDSTSFTIDDKLEATILSKIKELIKLTTRFEEIRTGTDKHSRILPTKLRQQIYAALGHRGFSTSDHPFITQLTKDLIDEMNKYRIIESEEKNIKLEKEIITIITQVLRIFYFRLHTQEPIPSFEFYKSGDCFDPNVMESTSQIEQSDEEELEVEICSFPVIALIKNSDDESSRVFTKAQVIVRPIK